MLGSGLRLLILQLPWPQLWLITDITVIQAAFGSGSDPANKNGGIDDADSADVVGSSAVTPRHMLSEYSKHLPSVRSRDCKSKPSMIANPKLPVLAIHIYIHIYIYIYIYIVYRTYGHGCVSRCFSFFVASVVCVCAIGRATSWGL
jgi:hypothetical protein